MCQERKQIYVFHFKMDLEMKNKLLNLVMYKREGSFSKLIVKIFSLLSPCLEREHLLNKQRKSRYERVNDDLKINRESVYVYFPDFLYRQLKAMHNDLNFYSIAQLLRGMLRFFLGLVRCYGERVIEDLKYKFRKWKTKNYKRRYKVKSIPQLLHFIYQKADVRRFLHLYDHKFSLIGIYRL